MGLSGLRKPWWGWKSRACAELETFDIPFAVKEYCQNQVGQILKGLETRVWSDWERHDLTAYSQQARQLTKADLEVAYRAMFTGPHGVALRHSDWLPLYVVEANISWTRLLASTRDTDLKVCTVLWEHTPTGLCGLFFFNNHLDDKAKFSTFVVDGTSTSRRNEWAVGEKGKGFMLATQYLFEEVEQTVQPLGPSKSLKPGVSFRVGHGVGELKWRKSKDDEEELKVVLDDLTPTDLAGLMAQRGLNNNEDSSDGLSDPEGDEAKKPSATVHESALAAKAARSLKAIYKRRFKYKMSEKKSAISEASSPAHEISLVSNDEVSITVLGLPRSSPTKMFSGFYGILPPKKAWFLPNSQVQFFKSEDDKVAFYLRDQIILYGPTLGHLSVNYHGDMMVTSDRRVVIRSGDAFDAYCEALGEAADTAFRRGGQPTLATEVALEILQEKGGMHFSISRFLEPADAEAGAGYRAAFRRAWKVLNPQATEDAVFWPYPRSHPSDLEIIEELEMVGCAVSNRVMSILEESGAYTRIRPHTKTLLLAAPEVQDQVPGLERFRYGLRSVLGQDHLASISMREYSYSTPKILWDPTCQEFIFALPDACERHAGADGCLCWVGPCLFEAVENWKATQDGPGPSMSSICRAFVECMEGVEGMYEQEEEVDDSMDKDQTDEDSESKPRRSGEDRSSDTEAKSPLPGSPRSSLNDGSSDLSSLPRDGSRSSQGDSRPKQTRKSASLEPAATTNHNPPADAMVKFEFLSSHMRELGTLLQQRNDSTTADRAQIVKLKKQLEEANRNLQREREQLSQERQRSNEEKAQFEREREELEDRLEQTQQLLQTQWSTRSEERKAKRRREE